MAPEVERERGFAGGGLALRDKANRQQLMRAKRRRRCEASFFLATRSQLDLLEDSAHLDVVRMGRYRLLCLG